jgi:peptide/nickel transport system permease protein
VTSYLARRAAQAIVVVIGVMIVTFIMIHMVPGSAARAVLGLKATPQKIAIFNQAYGLNKPLYVQFFDYVVQVCHGNLGTSYELQQPVSTLIIQRMPEDALLLGVSTILALAIAIPMGIYQAVKRNRPSDYLLDGVSFTLYTMPDFFLALMLIALCCVQFHWLPPLAPQSTTVGGVLADPAGLVLPVLTLTLSSVAGFSRYMRASAIDVLAQDFLRTARAKGMTERRVLARHVVRNSILPIVTLVGLSLPAIFGGAIITEEIFNYQGVGLLFFQAAISHDFPILLGGALIAGVTTVAGNLAAEVAYGFFDPRIRNDHA